MVLNACPEVDLCYVELQNPAAVLQGSSVRLRMSWIDRCNGLQFLTRLFYIVDLLTAFEVEQNT